MDTQARGRWMSILAQAAPEEVEAAWRKLAEPPAYRLLRGPETGLVMVRGRAGGTGVQFNLGEMTVTRCSVELDDGRVGHAYVGGRSGRHAERAAAFDALLQEPGRRPALDGIVIAPLLARQEARRAEARARAAGTRVEFFTMVRGEE
ncbi:MAG TPA: phosphonate C-P lyase system protein PhnG [Candidatus Limnocylindria bacterium]|nr:phosphonate C-P lyase system protein PhnG [Candidatus Limnocylindria bacterium]